jgi:hypothetical protein
VFARLNEGHALRQTMRTMTTQSNWYYLADEIYLKWLTFVKSNLGPYIEKHSWFSTCKEACRKDVERVFDVLQARLLILGTLL